MFEGDYVALDAAARHTVHIQIRLFFSHIRPISGTAAAAIRPGLAPGCSRFHSEMEAERQKETFEAEP